MQFEKIFVTAVCVLFLLFLFFLTVYFGCFLLPSMLFFFFFFLRYLNRNELKKMCTPTQTLKAKTVPSSSPCNQVMDVFTADRIALIHLLQKIIKCLFAIDIANVL